MERDEILSLTVEGLKTKLEELKLSKTGNKDILQERLLKHFNLEKEVEDGSEYGEASSVVACDVVTLPYSNFSLRDVQDSVSTFSGDGFPEVSQWIQEFEYCSCAVKWNDLQNFIYGKQLLTGAAKIFARSEPGIKDWRSLKQALVKEFGRKLSSLDIHSLLRNRRKRPDETFRSYLYSLKEIGNPIMLDDQSLIEYFIEGIEDTRSNKSVLYQAKNLGDLKDKIEIYEKISARESSYFKAVYRKINYSNHKRNEEVRHCYNCGDKGHLSNICKSKEVKCFRCQGVGHKSYDCKAVVKRERNDMRDRDEIEKTENSRVHTMAEITNFPSRRISKDIGLMGTTVTAVVDTGSDVCTIRLGDMCRLGKIDLSSETKKLVGIGGKTINTLGSFESKISVDGLEVGIIFHVCRDRDVLYPVVIGNDIFDKVSLNINSEGAWFRCGGEYVKNIIEGRTNTNNEVENNIYSESERKLTNKGENNDVKVNDSTPRRGIESVKAELKEKGNGYEKGRKKFKVVEKNNPDNIRPQQSRDKFRNDTDSNKGSIFSDSGIRSYNMEPSSSDLNGKLRAEQDSFSLTRPNFRDFKNHRPEIKLLTKGRIVREVNVRNRPEATKQDRFVLNQKSRWKQIGSGEEKKFCHSWSHKRQELHSGRMPVRRAEL